MIRILVIGSLRSPPTPEWGWASNREERNAFFKICGEAATTPSRRRRVKLKNLKNPFPLWYCVPPSPPQAVGQSQRDEVPSTLTPEACPKDTVQLWPPFPSSFSYTEHRSLAGLSQTMGNGEYRAVAGGPGQGVHHFLLCQRIQMGIHFIQKG